MDFDVFFKKRSNAIVLYLSLIIGLDKNRSMEVSEVLIYIECAIALFEVLLLFSLFCMIDKLLTPVKL